MESRKRINIVTLKMVKESSLLYEHRQINAPSKAVNLIKYFTDGADREKFIVVALNTKNQPTVVKSRGPRLWCLSPIRFTVLK